MEKRSRCTVASFPTIALIRKLHIPQIVSQVSILQTFFISGKVLVLRSLAFYKRRLLCVFCFLFTITPPPPPPPLPRFACILFRGDGFSPSGVTTAQRVQGDQDAESSVVGGVLQMHLDAVLSHLFHRYDTFPEGSRVRDQQFIAACCPQGAVSTSWLRVKSSGSVTSSVLRVHSTIPE